MASHRFSRREKTQLTEAFNESNDVISPHIPQFISISPWYLNQKGLAHQRPQQDKQEHFDGIEEWYQRGARAANAVTKFRKGACTNCGAMTHKAKDCCERPRKIGAKWSGENFQPDEVVKEVHLDYDGKRDRWNGYDPESHAKVMEQFAKFEQERNRKKKEEGATGQQKPVKEKGENEEDSDDSEGEDEDKKGFLDTTEQPVGVKLDTKTRTTVRNLRIREDTAKYLQDLSPNAPYYDPKSRSMRGMNKDEETFVRQSGEVHKFLAVQGFSFTAYEKGQAIHMNAVPSQAELVYNTYMNKKETLNTASKDAILNKYGDQSAHDLDDKSLLLGQSEQFVEYTHDGTLLDSSKGKEKAIPSSKYEEDVYINNHTSVWGSFWDNGDWGYACCHQTVKRSYCTGESGKKARAEMKEEMAARQAVFASRAKANPPASTAAPSTNSKKRPLAKVGYAELTQEEYDEYRLKRSRAEDPMKDFLEEKEK